MWRLGKKSILMSALLVCVGCSKDDGPSNELQSPVCQKNKISKQYIAHFKNNIPTLVEEEHVPHLLKEKGEEITLIEPNYYLSGRIIPGDRISTDVLSPTVHPAQFFHDIIHTEAAWNRGHYGRGVTVAIVDTGVDISHPHLRGSISRNAGENQSSENRSDDDQNGLTDDMYGWNFVSDGPQQDDETGHGTAIAGIITGAAESPSLRIAPQAQILPIDFMTAAGGTEFHAHQSIEYAISRDAKIINNSWSANCSSLLKKSFVEWSQQNVIFVNAAGNVPIDVYANEVTPSSFISPNIINVGSSDEVNARSSFSGFGKTITLYAPGELIPIVYPSSGWDQSQAISGTSFSAAIVSGSAALLWSAFPKATAPEIISLLQDGAQQETEDSIKVLDIRQSLSIGRRRFTVYDGW